MFMFKAYICIYIYIYNVHKHIIVSMYLYIGLDSKEWSYIKNLLYINSF